MADSDEERDFLRYMYPLTRLDTISDKKPNKLPLNHLIFLSQLQNILELEKLYEKAKSIMQIQGFENEISLEDFNVILQRTKRWVDEIKIIIEAESDNKIKKNIMQKISLFDIPDKRDTNILDKLDQQQKEGIKILRNFLYENENVSADLIQNKIFSIAKEELDMAPRKLFEAIYQVILGKKYGPRLGSFLTLIEIKWLLERLNITPI